MYLIKRTNVLLSDDDHALLSSIVKKEGKTMGQLIREAIKKTYYAKNQRTVQNISLKIEKGWKLLLNPKENINYKELIEYGRK